MHTNQYDDNTGCTGFFQVVHAGHDDLYTMPTTFTQFLIGIETISCKMGMCNDLILLNIPIKPLLK